MWFGLVLGEPSYIVEVNIMENEEIREICTYHADFASAWEQAITLSCENGGVPAKVRICDEEIVGVQISQSYELDIVEEQPIPIVELSNMNMKRAEGFVDSMFSVNNGELILDGCYIDGEAEASASLIRVSGKSHLSLKDSTLVNNVGMLNEQTGDTGAGVHLADNAVLEVEGIVSVKNNVCVVPLSEETVTTVVRNVYMQDGATITVNDTLRGEDASSSIGITHQDGIIAGLTMMGDMDATFISKREELSGGAENMDVSDILEVFTSDDYPSYFLNYDLNKNILYWDKETRYLPEAGYIKLEMILLFVGLFGFIVSNLPQLKDKKLLAKIVTTMATVCMICGIVIGFLHIKSEQDLYQENMQIIQQMTELQESKRTTADVSSEAAFATEAYESEVEEEQEIGLPNDGREYFAVLELPQLGIKLPVLSEYSEAGMKMTPCVYYGSIETNNLVIVGHNYESQLAALNDFDENLEVILTCKDGTVYTYESFMVESLNPDQVDEMLTGNWDFTVFTCNYAGDKRIAYRCFIQE